MGNLTILLILFSLFTTSTLTDLTLTANSVIPTSFRGEIENPLPGKYPERCRYELYNPSNQLVYKIDTKTDYVKELGYGHWYVQMEDKDLRVPAFPQEGQWKLKMTFYCKAWIIDNYVAVGETRFNVIRGSLISNLFAPIYLYHPGLPLLGGEVCVALPGIFWFMLPFLILALIAILIRLWAGSIRAGLDMLKKKFKGVKI